MTTHTISATQVRNEFADIINRVVYNNEEFLVEKQGKPVAKIVKADDTAVAKASLVFNPPVFDMGGIKKIYTREDIYE